MTSKNFTLIEKQPAPIHTMTPNAPRIMAAIAYIIYEGGRRRNAITQYDIVKTLFLADRASLNKYGRPVTFDNYVAMKDGPVPSLAYNFLKADKPSLAKHHVTPAWHREAQPGTKAMLFTIDKADVETDALAPSDLDELATALTVVKALGFGQVRRLTHEDPAYVDAWRDEGPKQSYDMSYSLLFDTPNEEMAKELSFLSKHV